jgi:hypothetical protein
LFDFLFVGIFLALGEFKRFEHFFHVIERFAKDLDNMIDLVDGALNGSRRGGPPWSGWQRRRALLNFRCTFRFRCCFGGRRFRILLVAWLWFGLRRGFLGV